MNHQQHSKGRQQQKQEYTPISSTPRRPAGDSFDNGSTNQHNPTKRQRNGEQIQHTQPLERQQQLPTLSPPQRQQHSFNMNVLKRAVSNNFTLFLH